MHDASICVSNAGQAVGTRRTAWWTILLCVVSATCAAAPAVPPERIVVASGDSFEPLVFLNAEGEPDGVFARRWELWSEKTGVEVELRLMEWSQAIPALLAGKVDAVDGVTYTPERAEFLDLSSPHSDVQAYIFFHESIGGVRRLSDLAGFPVGVIKGSHREDHLRKEAPEVRPVAFASYEEMVHAAIGGHLHAFVGEEPTVSFLFAKAGRRVTFRRTEASSFASDLRVAVRKGEGELLSLIERGQAAITPEEHQRIRDEWTGVSLVSLVPWRWLMLGAGGVFLVVVLLATWNAQLRRRIAEATQTLREREERFRGVFESPMIGTLFWNADGDIADANDTFLQMVGYTRSDILSGEVRWRNMTPLEYAEQDDRALQEIAATGVMTPIEKEYIRKDGSRIPILLGAASLPGPTLAGVAFVLDVSERKKAEEALRDSEEKLSKAFHSAPMLMAFSTVDEGQFIDVNAQFLQTLGFGKDEVIGRTSMELGLFVDPVQRDAVVQEVRQEGYAESVDVAVRTKNGDVRHGHFGASLLELQTGPCLFTVMSDVTERVRMEQMLVQSEKMLSVGGLAAGMAHEINNPLAGILQNVQVIRSRMQDDLPKNMEAAEACGTTVETIRTYMDRRDIPQMMQSVMDSGSRAAEIVDNMLSFASKGGSPASPHSLPALLDRTVELASSDYDLKRKYDFRQIEIVREYEPDLPDVPCTGNRIQQVFLNVLKNGAEAMCGEDAAREPRFVLRVSREDGMVRVEIEDSGPGMDEETRKRVFEPFFTTKDVGAGTGLGLSVSYFIVAEDHGGTMAVESSPGVGAKFIIRLPLEGRTE